MEVLRNYHNKTLTNEQAVDSIAKSTKKYNYSFAKQLDGNNLREAQTHTTQDKNLRKRFYQLNEATSLKRQTLKRQ